MIAGLIILSLAFIAWHYGEKYVRNKHLDDKEEVNLKEKLDSFKGRQLSIDDQKEYLLLKKTRFPYQNTFMQSLCLCVISILTYFIISGFFESKVVCYFFVVLTSLCPSYIFALQENKKPHFKYVFWTNYLMLLFFNIYMWVQRYYTIEYNDWLIPLYLLLPYFWVLKFILNKIGDNNDSNNASRKNKTY